MAAFSISSALLDALVLSIVRKEDNYGYRITQEVSKAMSVSESTLYPVLRRLQKNGCLDIYDNEFQGRNRRYYRVTGIGADLLSKYLEEWKVFKAKIEGILLETCGENAKDISVETEFSNGVSENKSLLQISVKATDETENTGEQILNAEGLR